MEEGEATAEPAPMRREINILTKNILAVTYDENNIFAKILKDEMPSQKIYEDDNVLAFNDIMPSAPIHVLVIPKDKFVDYDDFVNNAEADVIANFFKSVAKIANMLDLNDNNYRLITNKGSEAGQTVKHFHVHILGKKQMGALL